MEFPDFVNDCLRKKICVPNMEAPVFAEFRGQKTLFGHEYVCAKTGLQCSALNCPLLAAFNRKS